MLNDDKRYRYLSISDDNNKVTHQIILDIKKDLTEC